VNVTFRFQRGHLIIPPVMIEHEFEIRPAMAIDTGARVTVIAPRLAEEVGIELARLEPNVELFGVAGSAWAVEVQLRRVSILGLAVENVRAICHPLPPRLGLDGILGLNFLEHFNPSIHS